MVSVDVFVLTSLAIAVPWLYSLRPTLSLNLSTALSVILLLHTLSLLSTLLLYRPPNIFNALNVPLNAPTDTIRALLLQQSLTPDLSPELEGLLQRLASFDVRTFYPRFGHNVLATCFYCHSFNDFALYALPRPLLSYIREIALIGLLTLPASPAASLRKPAVSLLIFLALGEAYMLMTVPITIPPRDSSLPITMWHDTLLLLRHIVFLLLPLLTHFLPSILTRYNLRIPFIYTPPPPSFGPLKSQSMLLAETHQTLNHLLPALHLLKYAGAATMRVPALNEHARAWWAEEAKVGELVRGDGADPKNPSLNGIPSVRATARSLNLGFDEANPSEGTEEGKLRLSAKLALGALTKDGLGPSEHWAVHSHP